MNELRKLEVEVVEGDDFLEIKPQINPRCFDYTQHKLKTYKDHRMAMALAPLAIIFGELELESPEVVNKSFPNYWEEIQKLGFTLKEIQ